MTEVKKVKKGVALAGVAAGTTAVCTVGHSGNDLHYRGYDILDLAKNASFEEVAYLLIYGELPTLQQLQQYQQKLASLRDLPCGFASGQTAANNMNGFYGHWSDYESLYRSMFLE